MKSIMLAVCLLFMLGALCFSVASAGTVTDVDGNTYQTVTIGTQVWMAGNLKVTHYRNGIAIPNDTDGTTWVTLTTGAYSDYDNDSNNVATYGRLYNWFAVADSQNIAPVGWHVPTDADWQQLANYLGGDAVAGGKLKDTGTAHWIAPNTGATNESGFSGLPGGYRPYANNGAYQYLYNYAYFWSSTASTASSGLARYLSYSSAALNGPAANKNFGFSVRCVKDCCVGTTGNVNMEGIVDLSDLTALVSYLTGFGYVLPCPAAANVNGVGIIDLSDLSALVSYLTGFGYVLPSCP
jgi:uncharacterized protein (TIGR02145 family)